MIGIIINQPTFGQAGDKYINGDHLVIDKRNLRKSQPKARSLGANRTLMATHTFLFAAHPFLLAINLPFARFPFYSAFRRCVSTCRVRGE